MRIAEQAAAPASPAAALAMLETALDCLNGADVGSLPASAQAECLRVLERAEAKHTAARAGVLAAFTAQRGFEDDGQHAARPWLKWQTRVTTATAARTVAWAKRLSAHPAIGRALAAGAVSSSWAREICSWTDLLPEARREAADEILMAAADGGATLADLAALAWEMRRQSAVPDHDDDDGFDDRNFRLGVTFRGAGRAVGDLTPGCTAALSAVLDALGKKAGPEDLRTATQRRHDALEEACRRLIASGMLPARAGQPTQAQVHMTLSQLRHMPDAAAAEAAWRAARAVQPGWLAAPEADGAACDSTLVPLVSGHVDQAALDRMTEAYLAAHGLGLHDPGASSAATGSPAGSSPAGSSVAGGSPPGGSATGRPPGGSPPGGSATGSPAGSSATGSPAGSSATMGDQGLRSVAGGDQGLRNTAADSPVRGGAAPGSPVRRDWLGAPCGCECGGCTCPARGPMSAQTLARLRQTMLALATEVLSGPGGLASWLRTSVLSGPDAAPGRPLDIALPLDAGEGEAVIPAHLRRAVALRHPLCAFPGCEQATSCCQVHHLTPRSLGGPTVLSNLVPLCAFHHLIVIHRWGWTLRLHPDGSTAATGPDGRILHSHGPPGQPTGPPGQATGPPGQPTGPPGQPTGPPGQATGPPGQATGPPGQATGPPGQAA